MKVAVLAFFIAVVAANDSFRLPANDIAELKQIHDACQANTKTYCDENLLKKLVDNRSNNQVGIHMLCMAEKAGLMQHNGKLNLSTIKNKITLGAKPGASVNDLANKCASSKSTPESTAVEMIICFVQNDIHYYHRL